MLRPAKAVPWGCNFETNTCKWTQATDDTFDWTRNRGKTSSVQTGPGADHTLGNCKSLSHSFHYTFETRIYEHYFLS